LPKSTEQRANDIHVMGSCPIQAVTFFKTNLSRNTCPYWSGSQNGWGSVL